MLTVTVNDGVIYGLKNKTVGGWEECACLYQAKL